MGKPFPAEVVKRVFQKVVPHGDCLLWPGDAGRFRIKVDGVFYNARHVVAGPVPAVYTRIQTCGNSTCIAKEHQKIGPTRASFRKPRPPKYVPCHDCGRTMRPYNSTAEDHPGTVAKVGRGLCTGCYNRPKKYDTIRLHSDRHRAIHDRLIPPGEDIVFDPQVVYRTVPEDLWPMFGLEGASDGHSSD